MRDRIKYVHSFSHLESLPYTFHSDLNDLIKEKHQFEVEFLVDTPPRKSVDLNSNGHPTHIKVR